MGGDARWLVNKRKWWWWEVNRGPGGK